MSTSSHPILLAALDLDGTLLNSNGEVSPCTQKVLSEVSDRGVVVIPATGRPLASLPPVVAKQPSPLGAPQGTNSGSIPIRLDCTGLPAPQVRPFQVRYIGNVIFSFRLSSMPQR